MAIYITRQNFEWKEEKNGIEKSELQDCPRCKNKVRYRLAWDSEGIGIAGFNVINTKKVYAYKCPICPHFEPLDREVAKAIIERSKC